MSHIVFDIGGTKTRVGLTEDLKTITELKSFSTPSDFQTGVKKMAETVKSFKSKSKDKIESGAGGIRGLLMEDKSGMENDNVLTGWAKKPLTKELSKLFGAPFYLENDTALAGLGEATFGAGKGVDIVVYHTVSTGVGGVKIEKGEIDTSSFGFEPGHQVLDIDRTILGEDVTPTLENLVSGSGLEARMGVKPYEIPQSDMIWEELAEYLAQGLRNSILYWSPDMIILGGSMILGDPKIPLESIRKYTVASLNGFVVCPFITTAELSDNPGLYGAMAYLETQKAKKKP
jgi:predicted NBD/HSP70 family sugar kinase